MLFPRLVSGFLSIRLTLAIICAIAENLPTVRTVQYSTVRILVRGRLGPTGLVRTVGRD